MIKIYILFFIIFILIFTYCNCTEKSFFRNKKNWILKIPLHEKKITSQGKQDGVIEYIINNINIKNKYCVEFGFSTNKLDGSGGPNTMNLIKKYNWEYLLLDGGNENIEINLHKHILTTDNICEIFEKYNVPKEPGYISIDVDSIDIWLCDEILKKYSPSFFSIEINPNIPIDYALSFPNDGTVWKGDKCMGSSLKAIKLMVDKHKKYDLVYVGNFNTSQHHDAFFIRKDLIKDLDVPKLKDFKNILYSIHRKCKNDRHNIYFDYDHYLKTGNMEESKNKAEPIARLFCS
jgi:hypothetical protein